MTGLQITRCKVAPSITTGQSIKWLEANQRPGRHQDTPTFSMVNCQKLKLSLLSQISFLKAITRPDKASPFSPPRAETLTDEFCLAFCRPGPVLSRRKQHKEASCQAAYLYSCEGHIRRHGTRHKSEISLVTSHPHCALMSTRERLGIVLSMRRIRISA